MSSLRCRIAGIVFGFSSRCSLMLLLGMLLASCASTPQNSQPVVLEKSLAKNTNQVHAKPVAKLQSQKEVLQTLYKQYERWRSTPYRWGGLDRRGLDCSGLVYLTFQEQLGRQLPRASREQRKVGKKISRKHLRAGDLVFFKTGPNQGHVGIYLEHGKFLHVSTKRGVMISHLSNAYWHPRYVQSRRVL